MNITLISYRIDKHHQFRGYTHNLPPLGLAYIAAVLLQRGHQVNLIDRAMPPGQTERLAREILSKSPDVVGISVMSENYQDSILLLDTLKALNSELVTVIGGAHVNGMPEKAMIPASVDFGILGEAEWAFAALIDSNFDRIKVELINGVLTKNIATGKINRTQRALISSVDDLPLPARHLFAPLDRYRPSILTYRKLPATGLFTSRGCFGRCIFCTSGKGKYPLRFHSTEYVLNEISELWHRFGIRELVFLDDTFSASKKRVLSICEGIRKHFPDLSWSAQSRADYLDYEILKTMRRSGCWQIQIGVESGSDTILKNLKKGISLEQVETAVRQAYDLGFIIKGYFILGSPGETTTTIMQTFRLMKKLPIHYASINLLVPLPGTYLWDNASRWGEFNPDAFYSFNYLSGEPVFTPKGMTAPDLKSNFKTAYRNFYLYPPTIWRNLKTIKSPADIKRYADAGYLMAKMLFNKRQ